MLVTDLFTLSKYMHLITPLPTPNYFLFKLKKIRNTILLIYLKKVYKIAKKTIINDIEDREPRMADIGLFARALKFSSAKKLCMGCKLSHGLEQGSCFPMARRGRSFVTKQKLISNLR